MIYLFIKYPLWYFIPMLITLMLQVISVRLFRKYYKGEAELLLDPTLIFGLSFMWFLLVPAILVLFFGWVGGKMIGYLIGSKNK